MVDEVASPAYYATMVSFGIANSKPAGKSEDAISRWFVRRSTDAASGVDTYRWAGPLEASSSSSCVTYSSHAEVWRRLQELGAACGTNDHDGKTNATGACLGSTPARRHSASHWATHGRCRQCPRAPWRSHLEHRFQRLNHNTS